MIANPVQPDGSILGPTPMTLIQPDNKTSQEPEPSKILMADPDITLPVDDNTEPLLPTVRMKLSDDYRYALRP
jgi:hypothetical protein